MCLEYSEYHSATSYDDLLDPDSYTSDFFRFLGEPDSILWGVCLLVGQHRVIADATHQMIDAADSSLDTPVHDAIYSIARSPVFAQRHEDLSTATATRAMYTYKRPITLGTLAMLGAILP